MSDSQKSSPQSDRIAVEERLLTANEQVAADNRIVFTEKDVKVINIMASPGAGKTTLLMATIETMGDRRIGVIEGDVASQIDADKIATTGAPVVQINTGGGCHLDAPMIRSALPELSIDGLDLVFIENVGNLICPVSFDLGQSAKVCLISVPEGHDKPYKYPGIFEAVDVIVVTKLDLMPYLDFDLDIFRNLVHGLNPDAPVLCLSAKTGEGMESWVSWLEAHLS